MGSAISRQIRSRRIDETNFFFFSVLKLELPIIQPPGPPGNDIWWLVHESLETFGYLFCMCKLDKPVHDIKKRKAKKTWLPKNKIKSARVKIRRLHRPHSNFLNQILKKPQILPFEDKIQLSTIKKDRNQISFRCSLVFPLCATMT